MGLKVAKVIDAYTLVINAGSESGIGIGQRFLVYAIGEEVLDPDTGESLGVLELVKGTGKATHVQERMCTVSSDMKAAAGRSIRRRTKNPFNSIAELYAPVTEEVLPAEKVPFEDPLPGDLAKQL
jgi:hypothetical protein